MCGIAGYSCSPAWCDTFIDQEKQNRILEEAWLHNQHRGYDAAGYMAVNSDDRTRVFKSKGSAAELLAGNKPLNVPIAKVFGVHTRLTTQGSEEDNRNNHPVFWNNIWVTHNGSINNDGLFREYVSKEVLSKLPDVDTVAINLALSEVSDPYDIDDIADSVLDLQGSFAFHAIWQQHPGLSLLVRGIGSPLVVAYHNAGCVVYGSEKNSVWHIINAMDASPEETWEFRDMNTGQLMLIKDGLPIAWKSLPVKSHGWVGRLADFSIERILPEEKDRKSKTVYSTSRFADFALEGDGHGRSMASAKKPKHIQTLYTRDKGFFEPSALKEYPAASDSAWHSVISEADSVFQNTKTSNLHVFYGDIEVVMDKNRAIQDIYNHQLFEDEERWQRVEKEEKKEKVDEVFEDYLSHKSTPISTLPKEPQNYAYIGRLGLGKGGTRDNPTPLTKNGSKDSNVGRATSRNPHFWHPITVLGWEEIFTENTDIALHNTEEELIFLQVDNNGGGSCSKHNVKFVDHSSPRGCTYLTTAAAFAYANILKLDVLDWVFGTKTTLVYTQPPGTDVCKKGIHHKYVPSGWKRATQHNVEFDILIAEICTECGISKEITTFPPWLENMFKPGVYRSVVDEKLPDPFETLWSDV